MNSLQIQVFQPDLGKDELDAVSKVFARSWPGRGEEVKLLEAEFAHRINRRPSQVLTTNSCTEGLFQILEHLDLVGYGVIMPTNSFVGAANAVISCGMRIQFCDIDESSGNATLETIVNAKDETSRVILIQHFGGIPAEIHEIVAWANNNGFIVIEDAAGATFSTTSGEVCGTIGDFGVWSLDSMKMIVAGDGGVVYCRDDETCEKLRSRTYLGLNNVSGANSKGLQKRWWEFDVASASRRSIMNDISAAIGRVQLKRLDQNIQKRINNASYYISKLSGIEGIELPISSADARQCHYFFPIKVPASYRDELANWMLEKGIYTTFRYFPLNRVKLYNSTGSFPCSDNFAATTLLIPQHSLLEMSDLERISNAIIEGMDFLSSK